MLAEGAVMLTRTIIRILHSIYNVQIKTESLGIGQFTCFYMPVHTGFEKVIIAATVEEV